MMGRRKHAEPLRMGRWSFTRTVRRAPPHLRFEAERAEAGCFSMLTKNSRTGVVGRDALDLGSIDPVTAMAFAIARLDPFQPRQVAPALARRLLDDGSFATNRAA